MDEGRILEFLTRIMGRIDGIDRGLDELKRLLETLASTIYAQCLAEHLGTSVTRWGLPARVDALARAEDKLYIAKFKIIATYHDAEEIKRIAPYVAGLLGEEEAEVVPVIVASRYEGGEPPSGVSIILC